MNTGSFNQNITSLNNRNLWLTVVCAALALSVLALSIFSMNKHERIVVVPPGLTGEVSIGWSGADVQYMNTMGTAFAVMVGSINPKNVEATVDRLSALSEPSFYSELRKKLLARTLHPNFVSSGVSTIFMPTAPAIYEAETNTVFVIGEEVVNTGYGMAKNSPYIYEVALKIAQGRPVIYSLKTYPGIEPHTTKWKIDHPDKAKEQP